MHYNSATEFHAIKKLSFYCEQVNLIDVVIPTGTLFMNLSYIICCISGLSDHGSIRFSKIRYNIIH